jgi:hypothetical protein
MQTACFDTTVEIPCHAAGEAPYGRDAKMSGAQPSYADNGIVGDALTGLIWAKTPDLNGDVAIGVDNKLTLEAATDGAEVLELGGHDDWRLQTIKGMYSLMNFRGVDPSGITGTDTSGLTPFIDRAYFDFDWGDTDVGERLIDAQMVSTTLYVSVTQPDDQVTLFGVNFAD